MRLFSIVLILLSSITLNAAPFSEKILSVYATFEKKTTHDSITINYLASEKSKNSPVLYLGSEPGLNRKNSRLKQLQGRRIDLPNIDTAFVYSTQIDSLEPNTTYYFYTGDDKNGFTPEMSFKTLPNDSSPIVLLQGGDMGPDSAVKTIPQTGLKNNPDVILIGGDISYANGKSSRFNRWLLWFEHMNEVMISSELRVTPLIVAVGNHEIRKREPNIKLKAPYYFSLFPQNGYKPFFSRKLGQHSTLFVLDSDHVYPAGGQQKAWMLKEFEAEKTTPNKLALYHVPLYPAHRSFHNSDNRVVRSQWLSVFDKYNLTVAFENHDHVYKRTHMLKNNQIVNSGGTVYVGDGCWGRKTRSTENRWYLRSSEPAQHIWSAILESNKVSLQASAELGIIYDEFYIDSKNKVVVESPWYFRGLPRPLQKIISN